jgi:tetratricopeptide (TPR) repeat protein
VAQQKVNRFHLAEKEFEFIRSKKPFDPEIKRQLGWTKVMMGKIEEGRKLLREAISAQLTSPAAYVDLGTSYIFTLNFDEGFQWLETAKNLDPKDPFIIERIKEAKRMEKDFQKFSENDKKIMRQMRNDPQELKMMAIETMLNLQLGIEQTKEETEDVRKELELAGLNPNFVEIRPPKTKEQKTHVEYLKYHQIVEDVERKISREEFEKLKEKLLNQKISIEEIKKILIVLAHQGKKEVVEFLEEYQEKAPEEVKDFANLALEECKIFLKAPPGKIVKIIHS